MTHATMSPTGRQSRHSVLLLLLLLLLLLSKWPHQYHPQSRQPWTRAALIVSSSRVYAPADMTPQVPTFGSLQMPSQHQRHTGSSAVFH
jgi:hypothetical protein